MIGPFFMRPATARALLAKSRAAREAAEARRRVRKEIEAAFNQARDIGFEANASFELAHIHVLGTLPKGPL